MKKILVLVGAPVSANNRYKEARPLARVYFTRPWLLQPKRRLVVKPEDDTLKPFAQEVERRIKDRLENHPDQAFVCPDPDPEHPHGRRIATANDPNLLDAIRSDLYLWGDSGDDNVAEYYVLSTYSNIEER